MKVVRTDVSREAVTWKAAAEAGYDTEFKVDGAFLDAHADGGSWGLRIYPEVCTPAATHFDFDAVKQRGDDSVVQELLKLDETIPLESLFLLPGYKKTAIEGMNAHRLHRSKARTGIPSATHADRDKQMKVDCWLRRRSQTQETLSLLPGEDETRLRARHRQMLHSTEVRAPSAL